MQNLQNETENCGGSTNGLHEHLERVHGVTVLKRKIADDDKSPMPTTSKRIAAGASMLS